MEDGEELEAAMAEWMHKQLKYKKGTKGPPLSPLELKLQEMREADPEFARMEQMLERYEEPQSLADNMFLPDEKAYAKEADRLESMAGRYPYGYRHLENYLAYKRKFPEATIQDYRDDSK